MLQNFPSGKKNWRFLCLSLFFLFCGCGSQPSTDSRESAGQNPKRVLITSDHRIKRTNPALTHLQELASQATASQDYERANVLLERALRLAPNEATIYLELAQVKAASGNLLQALVFAERGLLYCQHPICSALTSFIKEKGSTSYSQ